MRRTPVTKSGWAQHYGELHSPKWGEGGASPTGHYKFTPMHTVLQDGSELLFAAFSQTHQRKIFPVRVFWPS